MASAPVGSAKLDGGGRCTPREKSARRSCAELRCRTEVTTALAELGRGMACGEGGEAADAGDAREGERDARDGERDDGDAASCCSR